MVRIERERVSSAVFGVANRRVTSRFPVAREIRYRLVESRPAGKGSVGKTLNISRGGVLFTTTKRLPHGHLGDGESIGPLGEAGIAPSSS